MMVTNKCEECGRKIKVGRNTCQNCQNIKDDKDRNILKGVVAIAGACLGLGAIASDKLNTKSNDNDFK